MSDRPLTIDEAAEYFSVSPDTIKKWIDSGELSAFSVNVSRAHQKSRLRISQSSIQEFERERIKQPARLPPRRKGGYLERLEERLKNGNRNTTGGKRHSATSRRSPR